MSGLVDSKTGLAYGLGGIVWLLGGIGGPGIIDPPSTEATMLTETGNTMIDESSNTMITES